MKIIQRIEFDDILKLQKLIKESNFNIGGYSFAESTGVLVVETEQNKNLISGILEALLSQDPIWFLFPKFTYFNSEGDNFEGLGISSINDEAIEWDRGEIRLITDIVLIHFQKGWHLGWDLYLVDSQFNLLVSINHHQEIEIKSCSTKALKSLNQTLSLSRIDSELYEV
jgi:hypothetical protein